MTQSMTPDADAAQGQGNQKPRVLLLGQAITETPFFTQFCTYVEPIRYQIQTRQQFIEDLNSIYNDIQGLWFAMGGIYCLKENRPIVMDQEFVELIPKTIKIIAIPSIGFDRYDIAALNRHGIILTNTPALASDQVADTALYHVLNSFRHYTYFDHAFRIAGSTTKAKRLAISPYVDEATGFPVKIDETIDVVIPDQIHNKVIRTPKGHTAGIIGLGAIGQELAKRLNVLGMKIHYTKRNPLTELELIRLGNFPIQYHDHFETLLPICDVLIFCVPLNAATKHMLNEQTIAQCKKGVRIVNIGRGATIDEVALLKALKNGDVAFAGLDVFENEPVVNPELLQRYDMSLSPHIGSSTLDNRISSSEHCQKNILNVLIDGGEGLTPVVL